MMSAESAESAEIERSDVDVADVEAFLSGSLNKTPEQAREFVDRLYAWGHRNSERDQGDLLTVDADEFLDVVEMARHLMEMWEDDTHVLHLRHDDFSTRHPVKCRSLDLNCPTWRRVQQVFSEGDQGMEHGDYLAGLFDGDKLKLDLMRDPASQFVV